MLVTVHQGDAGFESSADAGNGRTADNCRDGFDAQYSPTGHIVYGTGTALFAVPFDVGRLTVASGPAVKLLDGVRPIPWPKA